ncbi:uncharacterized protein LOC111700623 [Eurytemora carolleeae]|uniref:uncharacterized protein LOC111700623 n=1 Tax=Eurytemora carolleeae TaxID=1294199 RepID=UPI000C76FFC6|nr:uncharacterized protein LOC111700623 [Eurytemora carolleeae]|eukprot:XP_023327363.1 uncharacterized protein LOC111700623 [Eurytemora affinis]
MGDTSMTARPPLPFHLLNPPPGVHFPSISPFIHPVAMSYAKSWQENLKRLQRPEISLSIRPPSSEFNQSLRPPPCSEFSLRPPPSISLSILNSSSLCDPKLEFNSEIKSSFKLEDESGALNLSKGGGEDWSPPPSTSPDTSRSSPPRSPQGYRPPTYTSLEICVVCGDRASGLYLLNFYILSHILSFNHSSFHPLLI